MNFISPVFVPFAVILIYVMGMVCFGLILVLLKRRFKKTPPNKARFLTKQISLSVCLISYGYLNLALWWAGAENAERLVPELLKTDSMLFGLFAMHAALYLIGIALFLYLYFKKRKYLTQDASCENIQK